ncbi:MAG TPA: hypothetical protein V6D08_05010 [Candidatus Obscuribacterales bacterium]
MNWRSIGTLSRVLRLIALSVLFAGSAAIVFAAITLVKAAQAQGVPVAEAANANAPLFIQFSKVALAAGMVLLLAECLDFAGSRRPSKLTVARYVSSLLCVATTMIFAFGIVPPLEQLRPRVKTDPAAHAEFHKLHEVSRMIFGSTILLALVSLVIPAFGPDAGCGREQGAG